MDTFERMGIAILDVVAGRDLELVKAFGAASVDWLLQSHPELLAPSDPRESVMRFQVMRQSFFDFDAITLVVVTDQEAQLKIAYQMGAIAEEAASFQALGFFVRLLELAGAKDVQAKFTARSWAGEPETNLELNWS
jgi:hypothetical protein